MFKGIYSSDVGCLKSLIIAFLLFFNIFLPIKDSNFINKYLIFNCIDELTHSILFDHKQRI